MDARSAYAAQSEFGRIADARSRIDSRPNLLNASNAKAARLSRAPRCGVFQRNHELRDARPSSWRRVHNRDLAARLARAGVSMFPRDENGIVRRDLWPSAHDARAANPAVVRDRQRRYSPHCARTEQNRRDRRQVDDVHRRRASNSCNAWRARPAARWHRGGCQGGSLLRRAAVALRHLCFDDAGLRDFILAQRGFDLRYCDAPIEGDRRKQPSRRRPPYYPRRPSALMKRTAIRSSRAGGGPVALLYFRQYMRRCQLYIIQYR